MGKRLLSGILCAVMCLGFCVLPGCGEEQQTAATVPHTVLSYGCTEVTHTATHIENHL